MDIVFNCPKCDQELAVDSSGGGSEINCPACGEKIVIPHGSTKPPSGPLVTHGGAQPVNPSPRRLRRRLRCTSRCPSTVNPAKCLSKSPWRHWKLRQKN